MNAPVTNLSRRAFVAGTAAAGLSLGFHVPFSEAAAQGAASALTPEVNAWVVIKPDETVVIRIARSEMGQGTLTGLAQLVAEELGCDWSKVVTEYPTPGQNVARGRVWGDFGTGGSRGIRESQDYVRKGGAAARIMLVEAAAKGWGVALSECRVEKGVISHADSGRTTTFGAVAMEAAKVAPPKDIVLKDPKDWTIAGKPVKRLDTVEKTDGSQIYGIDLTMPGLLNAAIRDCPVFGGTVKSFDAKAVEGMPGVKRVVAVGDSGVAVIADTFWRAKTAVEALPIVWDEGPNGQVSSETIAATLREGLDAKEAYVGNKGGDVTSALKGATRVVEATYGVPFQNHATMEPMNATVRWTPERCEAWAPTQNGEAALAAVAEAAGLSANQCDVYKLLLGGGFGRRGATHDWLRQAVLIAKEMPGTPIKLIWTREEDMTHGRYHPITQCRMRAGLDEGGNLTGLHMRISGQSILVSVAPNRMVDGKDPVVFQGLNPGGAEAAIGYAIPNILVDHAMRNPHVPPGFWRGVNMNPNAIYLECFMDELAHAAGQDPLAFRLKLMDKHPKHRAVLQAVADKAGWGSKPPQGIHRGLAQMMGFGSYVAAVAEVSVGDDGAVKVHRIVAATDPGHALNPQQIDAQIAGSFVYGLSAALYQECTVKDGRIEQTNFDTYPVMRLEEMPVVETIVMPSGGFWGGVGEPTIAVAAPAVLNAIFAATGKRVRQMPVKNTDLRRA
ncbi:aldehyde dehydrogenase [Methylobacterium sp. Leaf104]|uniref:xanthine dehydrogenase family protein molybdopterin-binding subunit n=1 Tax=Methylobacterium TaxID=407 RepID=UPI0006F95D3C|nr:MULTISPECIES: molybdopterin cofactor-binding domain-containing protein [Methylobacterium]KQP38317.1 aldehyde dehydrogenase [Methylobacterium sp. Leaf104]MCI9880286.1 xanthine dehydrogenase family protein molybdopterin-binding subunit [Methylobacterium goesingense]